MFRFSAKPPETGATRQKARLAAKGAANAQFYAKTPAPLQSRQVRRRSASKRAKAATRQQARQDASDFVTAWRGARRMIAGEGQ